MNLKNVEKLEKNMVTITVEVGKDEFEDAVIKSYQKQVKNINIDGFRPGRAPRKVIEKMYGSEVFYEEAINIAVPAAYAAAIEEAKLDPVDYPQIEVDGEVTADGFTFKATIPNYPEVKLGQYKGLSAVKPSAEVTEELIEQKLKELQERGARLVPAERAAQNGDTAVIDFEGKKDGVPFEGGKAENYPLELGSGSFIPGFEEQVVGMNAGDEKDINVTFPEDYQAEDLAGKPVVFTVKVHEIKIKELPELDDEFAKDVSEFDTLDELKENLRKSEKNIKENAANQAFENNLVEQIVKGMEVDIPEAMIVNQAKRVVDEYKMQIQSQGIKFEDYLKMSGMKEEDLLDSAKEPATRQLNANLALEAVIDAEKLEASEEEIEEEFKNVAEQCGMEVDELKKYLKPVDLEDKIKREKAIKIVVESATVAAE